MVQLVKGLSYKYVDLSLSHRIYERKSGVAVPTCNYSTELGQVATHCFLPSYSTIVSKLLVTMSIDSENKVLAWE